jgi:hypothetical protein
LGSALDAAILGYSMIGWNAHAFDWLDHDAEWMANHLIANLRPGSIICLHDALHYVIEERHANRSPTIRAVDLLLEEMSSKYQFVTIPELLRMGRANRWGFGPVNRGMLKGFKPNDGPFYSYDDEGESR